MPIDTIPDKIRVLIVDDDEDDALIMRRHLAAVDERSFAVEWVSDFDEACERIYDRAHDVYLIDYRLGEKSGIELLQVIDPESRKEPFIIMSGANDRELLEKSMRFAAADFLVKGTFDAETLSRAIYYALQRKSDEARRVDYLVELNRSKDEFISIASHQLRTPATGVKQYLGLLREGFVGSLTEAQLDILEKAYLSNERQLGIVNDLLRVARVDSGSVKLVPEETNLNMLVEDVTKDLQSVFVDRGQEVVYRVMEDDIVVMADTSSIRMVIENILENASKYSLEGTTITLETGRDDNHAYIMVADQGVGIPLAERNRLFEKFSRIDNTLSTKVGGTGLGLYWAKKMVDLHNGDITYTPNKPKGSVFTIKLPKQ